MRKFFWLCCLLPLLAQVQEFSPEKVQYLVYTRNWSALEQKLKSGEIVFPESEGADYEFLLGYALLKQGKSQEAIEPLIKSANLGGSLKNYAHFYLGIVFADLGQSASAQERYLQVEPLSSIYLRARLNLIEQYVKSKQIEPALRQIELFRKNQIPGTLYPELLFLEAECYQLQGQSKLSQDKQLELYLNFPASASARKLKAIPYLKPEQKLLRCKNLLNAGMPKLAREELKELRAELKDPEDKILPQVLGLLAQAYFLSRDYYGLVKMEKEGHKLARANDEFWFYLAWSYHRLGRDEDAEKRYNQFMEKFPNSRYVPRVLYNLARINESRGELSLAQQLFAQIAKLYQDYELAEEARFQSGLILFRQGNYAQAVEVFNQALSQAKKQDQFIYWLAKTYEQNEEIEKARQLKQQLVDNFPTSPYSFLLEPLPKPFARESLVKPDFCMNLPEEFSSALALARFGLLDLAQEELNWQLKQKEYPFQTLLGLANKLMELKAYCLLTRLYHNYLSPKLNPEQKISYLPYLYPTAFSELVQPRALKYNIDPSVAYALLRAESNFHPSATSSAGAIGLAQVMPFVADATMRKLGLKKVDRNEYYNPELNLEIGFYHLNELKNRYQLAGPEPWPLFLMLCAYNAGTQPVDKWFENAAKWAITPDLWMEMIPYSETREYLKRILAGIYIYRELYPELQPTP